MILKNENTNLKRQKWAEYRYSLESSNQKTKRYGGKSHHHWYFFTFLLKFVKAFLKIIGFYSIGKRNAEDIKINNLTLTFSDLPESFDGFRIVHLSDLHLENHKGLENKVISLLDNQFFDLCVFTGDYQPDLHGVCLNSVKSMNYLVKNIKSKFGHIGVLGNHDTCHMVDALEDSGLKMLINESVWIEKDNQKIQIIGTDDVHYYYSDECEKELKKAKDGFTISLIHSPEIYDLAAESGVNLYLCGHTHGGQIALPGGFAPIRHLRTGKEFYKGVWQYKGMTGVTSCGVGTSGIPVRFNTRGEVIIIELKRS